MMLSGTDEDARSAFLRRFEEPLRQSGASGGAVTVAYETLLPWRVTGLTVRVAGLPEVLTITTVSVSLDNRSKDYATFPGDGVPHFELMVRGDENGAWLDHLVTCDTNAVLERATAWLDSRYPALPPTPEPIVREAVIKRLAALSSARDAFAPSDAALAEAKQRRAADKFAEAAQSVGLCLGEGAGSEAVIDVLQRMELANVFRNFPRGDDGRLALSQHVLLAPVVPATKIIDHARAEWVVLTSSSRRRDPEILTVSVMDLIGGNHSERWDLAPHLWTAEPETRGVMDEAMVRSCLTLQDAGHFAEAFALCGVVVDTDVWAYLAGTAPRRRFYLGNSAPTGAWQKTTRRFLWESAPWLWDETLNRLSPTKDGAQKRQGQDKPPFPPLLRLPNQTQQRKVGFFLQRNETGEPFLTVDAWGGNAVVPDVLWRRPVDEDIRRFGVDAAGGKGQ